MIPRRLKRSLIPAAVSAATAAAAVALLYMVSPFTGAKVHAQSATASHAAGKQAHSGGFTQPDPIDFDDHKGWTQIFDGKTLNGWDGSAEVWHVENGAIVGESSPEHPSGTTNIIWRGGQPANFELKAEMKLEGSGANGGIQYRSLNIPARPPAPLSAAQLASMTAEQKRQFEKKRALALKFGKWNMKGYQADFDYGNVYTGQLYEQSSSRGIVAWRGQMVETEPGMHPRLIASLGNSDTLKSYIKQGEWNQYEVIADGNTLIHIINGHVMAVLVDNDPAFRQSKGYIAFEIEGGGVVKISQRNVWLKKLP